MKPALSLSMSTLLSLAVASTASAATIASQYTLLPVQSNDIANSTYNSGSTAFTLGAASTPGNTPLNIRYTDWDAYPTNSAGQDVIIEKGTVTAGGNSYIVQLAALFDPANPSNGLVAIGPSASALSPSTTNLAFQTLSGISRKVT